MNDLMDSSINYGDEYKIKKKRISILDTYGENFQEKDYITHPSIDIYEQIKQWVIIHLTPD